MDRSKYLKRSLEKLRPDTGSLSQFMDTEVKLTAYKRTESRKKPKEKDLPKQASEAPQATRSRLIRLQVETLHFLLGLIPEAHHKTPLQAMLHELFNLSHNCGVSRMSEYCGLSLAAVRTNQFLLQESPLPENEEESITAAVKRFRAMRPSKLTEDVINAFENYMYSGQSKIESESVVTARLATVLEGKSEFSEKEQKKKAMVQLGYLSYWEQLGSPIQNNFDQKELLLRTRQSVGQQRGQNRLQIKDEPVACLSRRVLFYNCVSLPRLSLLSNIVQYSLANLAYIHLRDTKIQETSLKCLLHYVQIQNSVLEYLSLSGIPLSEQLAVRFCSILACTKLKLFALQDSAVNNKIFLLLLVGACRSQTLTDLSFKASEIDGKMHRVIEVFLRRFKRLRAIDIRGSKINGSQKFELGLLANQLKKNIML